MLTFFGEKNMRLYVYLNSVTELNRGVWIANILLLHRDTFQKGIKNMCETFICFFSRNNFACMQKPREKRRIIINVLKMKHWWVLQTVLWALLFKRVVFSWKVLLMNCVLCKLGLLHSLRFHHYLNPFQISPKNT
jgi:hypothetical protein